VDRITESLLSEFSKERELSSIPEDKRFEHFASYITVRRQHAETFDTADIVTGSGGDGGVDAIAVIVNGSLVTDVEAFVEQADRVGSLDVTFIFVQAQRSAVFETAKIGQFQFGVLDFFQDTPALTRTKAIQQCADIMSAIYERSPKFKLGNPACRLFYVTTGRWQNDPVLEARRTATVADLEATGLFREVEFHCVGADGIQTDIPQIGFGPSPILLPFGSFGKVESSSLAKDGALFICPAVPSLKNTDFPIIKTHLSLSFHSNA
jgi:hypothetical protein